MGEDTAQTVREIEETRVRLDAEVAELEDRLPDRNAWKKRMVPVAAAGGAGLVGLWIVRRALRRRREAKMSDRPIRAVLQVLPDEWAARVSSALEDERWKPWAAGAAALWVTFRMAELRQLRRMNQALLGGR